MKLFCIIMLGLLSYGMPLQAEETPDAASDRENDIMKQLSSVMRNQKNSHLSMHV